MASYIGIVHKGKKGAYGVSFPDFPGCITAGSTLEEAYAKAQEALPFHIEGMLEDGETVPAKPISFEHARRHAFFEGAVMTFMVKVRLPGQIKRVNIAVDEHLLKDIDSVAKNRSAFLAEAAREKLAQMLSRET